MFAPIKFAKYFATSLPLGVQWDCLQEWDSSSVLPTRWNTSCVLASGSVLFCEPLLSRLQSQAGPFIFAVDMNFAGIKPCSLVGACNTIQFNLHKLHLHTSVLKHANFCGVTTACHPVASRNVHPVAFTPLFSLPCTLSHIIDLAAKVHATEIVIPAPLSFLGLHLSLGW